MTAADWADPDAVSLTLYLDGSDDPDRAEDGRLLVDDDFLVLVNAWWQPLAFTIPPTHAGQTWHAELDTFDPKVSPQSGPAVAGGTVSAGPRSIVVLRGPRGG